MAEYLTIPIDEITVDQRIQPRKRLHEQDVEEYTQRIKDGVVYPMLKCGRLKSGDVTIYLVDGFHRIAAHKAAGTSELRVEVDEYESIEEMSEEAFRSNKRHGIRYTEEEDREGCYKIIKRYPESSERDLAKKCDVSPSTIHKYIQQLLAREQLKRPEKIIGTDGKEYRATKPATPAIPHEYCANKCGTPIWDDIKEAKDCAYVQWDGKWFCSEECAQAYLAKQPEPQEPPDEDDEYEDEDDEDDEPLPTCEICGISTVEPEKSGWIRTPDGRWCCSEECLNGFRKGWEQVECPRCGNKERRMYLEKFRWVHDKEGTWFCSKECRDVWPSLLKEPDLYPRAKAHLQSRAGGQKPEQETEPEEPDEFTFTDVDEETLPVCTEEHKETDELETQIIVRVRTKAFKTAQEFIESLSVIDGKFQIHLFGSDVDAEFLGLYENNNLINNNINTNPEIFTDFYVCCKSKKGREVKLFISKAKYAQWTRKFGPTFDIDQNLRECCDYYNELTGSEMLSAGGVYSKVYAWLLKNWKAQKKEESKPKKNAYKDAGLRFDPSDY